MNTDEMLIGSSPERSCLDSYKKLCLSLGIFTLICYVLRIFANIAMSAASPYFQSMENLPPYLNYAVIMSFSALFLQILPAAAGTAMFRPPVRSLYKKPPDNNKAIAFFPSLYGIAMTINFITIALSYLISSTFDTEELVNPIMQLMPQDTASALVMFIFLTVIAPVFEEYVFRGIILNALKPYGNSIAVFVSAFMFGAYHGNFSQFFYAFAIGIVLGYLACVTNSIFPTTILHAMINSISGILMILMTLPGVSKFINSGGTAVPDDAEMIQLNIMAWFTAAVLLTALFGLVSAVKKLINIKKFRLENNWTEIEAVKKLRMLAANPFMIISWLLIIDLYSGEHISELIIGFIQQR